MNQSLLSNNPDEDIAPVSPFGAIDYGVTEDDLTALAESVKDITSIENRKEYDAAQAALTKLVRARTSVESRRKELKAESLEFGRLVDSTAKELSAVLEPEESRLKTLIEKVKAQKAAEKAERERIEQERVEAIRKKMSGYTMLVTTQGSKALLAARDKVEAWEVSEGEYQDLTEEAQTLKVNLVAELNELYAGALHDEKIVEQERVERERKEAEQKAEAERLAKERADLEEKQRQIDEENARKQAELDAQQRAIDEERARVEAEKRAEAERIEREKREKAEAKAKAKAEKEAKELADRLRPDHEKLTAYIQFVDELEFPEVSEECAAGPIVAEIFSQAIVKARMEIQ